MQDKLGRGVVYAGCVGFRSLWRATALRGKNRAWEVAPMFRPEKAKSWPPLLFGHVDTDIVALTCAWPVTILP
jgi:hypothetical protein